MQKRAPRVQRPAAQRTTTSQVCPNCRAQVQEGDIICVACGTNLLTGQKIAQERQQQVAAAETRRLLPWIAVGVVVAVLLVIGGALLYYALTRDPVQEAVQLASSGDLLKASGVLTKYLTGHPDDARAQFALGKVYWKSNQPNQAADAFEAAAKLEPKNVEAAMLAVLSLAGGDSSNRARQRDILKRLTAQVPDNRDAWYLLALTIGAEQDVNGQVDALKKASELGATEGGTLAALGAALALQGDFQSAQQELDKAMAQMADDGDVAASMGFVASLSGDAESAEKYLRSAISGETNVRSEALVRLGILLISQGRFDDACETLTQAVAVNKNDAQAQYLYGISLEARRLNDEALKQYDAVAQGTSSLASDAAIRAASLNISGNNLDQAAKYIEKVEQAGVSGAALATVKGRLYSKRNEDDKAREAFSKAITLDANYAPAYLERGLFNVKMQLIKEGIQDLERYLSMVGTESSDPNIENVQALVEQLKQTTARPAVSTGGVAGSGLERGRK